MRAVDWRRRCEEAERVAEGLRDTLSKYTVTSGPRIAELETENARLRDRLRGAEITMGKAARHIAGLEKELSTARETLNTILYYKEISGDG